jgi:hypothetical protein
VELFLYNENRKEGRATFLRCQYCGKNLWPLRGLFDEDFCGRDHRLRYHERVRRALDNLPKMAGNPRPGGIAGFQFEKPRVQEPMVMRHSTTGPCERPAMPAMPDFSHASTRPSFAARTQSFFPLTPALAKSAARAGAGAVIAIAPNVLSVDSLRLRFEQNHGAATVAMLDQPASISPRPGNVQACPGSTSSPAVFDELNHVYVHVPDPLLEALLPVCGSLAAPMQPVATATKARHNAVAGPSGAGRVEFFPVQSYSRVAFAGEVAAEGVLPNAAAPSGGHIWLEDPLCWQVPVGLAPMRSSMAMLPMADCAAALERFRSVQPATATSASPLAWQFEAVPVDRSKLVEATGPAMASAMVMEFPAPGEGSSAPFSHEVAIFAASTFGVLVPEIAVETGDLEILAAALLAAEAMEPQVQNRATAPVSDEVAIFDAAMFGLLLPAISVEAGVPDLMSEVPLDLTPEHVDAIGRQTKIGATLSPSNASWLAMQPETLLPTSSLELRGSLAEPKLSANLQAKAAPTTVRNGAESLSGPLAISLPDCAVRLKHGPEFFAAEPVVAESVARPISAKAQAMPARLAMPEIQASAYDLTFEPAVSETVVPLGVLSNQAQLAGGAAALEITNLAVPGIDLAPAGFSGDQLKKVNLWARNSEEQSPRHFGCMEPQLELCLPKAHYDEYPLALQVSIPEPRTVTVFETSSYTEQPSNVLSISEARPAKRFTVPSYMKGMAAGLMLASFLWFGSSSIKTDGITMRPGDLIRLTIQRRAVYEVSDNFHAGLASWEGKGFSKTWAYDKEGFVRPGHLALYKPSHDMSDYKVEFLTQIERKSVGWVFRAEDDQNYYAMKLAVTEPGPRPLVALVRYAVVDGKRESHGQTPLQVMMHNNRPYRVSVDVKGNRFLTSIEGQVVDSWSDDRLKSGGVGLFAEGSEKARVYWLKVTKNSDFLGKLCSILVPKES